MIASLDDVMEFRGPLERFFAAGVVDLMTVLTRQNSVQFQNGTPRIEITVAIGNATGARRAFADEQLTRFTRRNFTANFTAITRPAPALVKNEGESDASFAARVNANNNLHAFIVTRIRSYVSGAHKASWSDAVNLPYHYIAEALKDAGSPSHLKPQEGNEQTTLSFTGQVGIHESAWL